MASRDSGLNCVVLVNPPHCSEETEDGVPVTNEMIQIKHIDSKFGAQDDEETDIPLGELQEKKAVLPGQAGATGFDACKEYGYKYEFAADESDEENNGVEPDSGASPSTTAVVLSDGKKLPYYNVLGKVYHPIHDFENRKSYENSLYWFTYRCDFPSIDPYHITSDAGFGCMLRSAQMMLAQALRMHFHSRNWTPPTDADQCANDDFVSRLLTWFADFAGKECIYSVHNMIAKGLQYDILPGEWYGPGTACYVIRDLVNVHRQSQENLFQVYVASEGTVYRDSVYDLMTKKSRARDSSFQKESTASHPAHPLDPAAATPTDHAMKLRALEWDTGLLLLVPLRLGLDRLNENYASALAKTFAAPQSVGILGGRPRGARWFYGAYSDGSRVLGLDPHTIHMAPRRRATRGGKEVRITEEYVQSLHTAYPETFPTLRMDPSLALAFYIRNRREFVQFEDVMAEVQGGSPELFSFADKEPDYISGAMNDLMIGSDEDIGGNVAAVADEHSDEDEYVML